MSFENSTLNGGKNIPDIQKLEMLKTGTTPIGMVIRDGVILATESLATAGHFVANKKAQKLFKINEQCGATIAGYNSWRRFRLPVCCRSSSSNL